MAELFNTLCLRRRYAWSQIIGYPWVKVGDTSTVELFDTLHLYMSYAFSGGVKYTLSWGDLLLWS
jgi:hypothetical protein